MNDPHGAPPGEARRLTGPNLFADAPGAVLDARWPPDAPPAAVGACAAAWGETMARLAGRLGWPAPRVVVRRAASAGGTFVSHFATAPVDQLDAAVDAAELAWAAAGGDAGAASPAAIDALAARAAASRVPGLAALLDAADARGLAACWDDDAITLGAGAAGRTWPVGGAPDAAAVDWGALGNVPIALVTGSNGKTTTARLVAAMLAAAGHSVGTSSTDGVRLRGPGVDVAVEDGDWAGPGGARLVLRDRRATAAVLETARGGVLRRGLAVRRADAACVTNIQADHFGEYGIEDLDALADAKLVVARALRPAGGLLVLSADDPTLAGRAATFADAPFRVCWAATDPAAAAAHALADAHAAAGGQACVARGGVLRWHDGRAWHELAPLAELPAAAGGRARLNVANAATAAALALALGAPLAAVRETLRTFGLGADDNPGRLEVVRVGDVTALVDYAHNADGLAALVDVAGALPARRRLLVLGMPGDRDDAALAAAARAAWARGPLDRVLLKDVEAMRRGRPAGEIPSLLRAALREAGAPAEAVDARVAATEPEAVAAALAWAGPGDLLVLPLHVERAAVVADLRARDAAGWRAGDGAAAPPS